MPSKTELRSKLKGDLIDYDLLINEVINDQSFSALLSLISDRNEYVRLRASYIIASIVRKIPELINVFYPKLLKLLNSENEGIRVAAGFVIEKLKEIINQNIPSEEMNK
ncbi:MAG: hypothetical protein QXY40_09745 [Candidatus Methanomethylicia archaeon]